MLIYIVSMLSCWTWTSREKAVHGLLLYQRVQQRGTELKCFCMNAVAVNNSVSTSASKEVQTCSNSVSTSTSVSRIHKRRTYGYSVSTITAPVSTICKEVQAYTSTCIQGTNVQQRSLRLLYYCKYMLKGTHLQDFFMTEQNTLKVQTYCNYVLTINVQRYRP